MKRLHRVLATIIIEQLINNHIAPTIKNIERYCTRILLKQYGIRSDTPVTVADWTLGIASAKEYIIHEPTALEEPLRERMTSLIERYKRNLLSFDEFLSMRSVLLERHRGPLASYGTLPPQ